MKQKYLPGNVRERLQDLMKQHKLTQAELSKKIDIAESTLSRFISGRTDKLGDESIIRIAQIFNVSTDFLLGVTNEPDRKNYYISELGLSAEAARNLYTGKINTDVVNKLLINPSFAEATYLISRYLNKDFAKGIAAQNQLYDSVAALLSGNNKIIRDISALKAPVYQVDLASIQRYFMTAVKEIKAESEKDIKAAQTIQKEIFDEMLTELTKGENIRECSITAKDIADQVANAVNGMNGINEETENQIRRLFIQIIGGKIDENE